MDHHNNSELNGVYPGDISWKLFRGDEPVSKSVSLEELLKNVKGMQSGYHLMREKS
jgi:hypothetical protein